jgi:hypothetical protein
VKAARGACWRDVPRARLQGGREGLDGEAAGGVDGMSPLTHAA